MGSNTLLSTRRVYKEGDILTELAEKEILGVFFFTLLLNIFLNPRYVSQVPYQECTKNRNNK